MDLVDRGQMCCLRFAFQGVLGTAFFIGSSSLQYVGISDTYAVAVDIVDGTSCDACCKGPSQGSCTWLHVHRVVQVTCHCCSVMSLESCNTQALWNV